MTDGDGSSSSLVDSRTFHMAISQGDGYDLIPSANDELDPSPSVIGLPPICHGSRPRLSDVTERLSGTC